MQTDSPLVSVVVPTYDRERQLQRALESIHQQSYENLEIIVVNGHPDTDPSGVFPDDVEIKYIQHLENHGISRTRNDGIAAATGEFVAFLDDDDEWKPEKVEMQVQKFQELDPEYKMVYAGRCVRDGSETTRSFSPSRGGDVYEELLERNFIASETPLVETKALRETGGFDEELDFGEDWEFWLRLAKRYKIGVVSEPLAIAHQGHSNRLSDDWEERYRSTRRILNKHEADFSRHPAALGRRHRKLGFYTLYFGDLTAARRHFRKSVRFQPSPVSLAGVCLTLSPSPIRRHILSLRQHVVANGVGKGAQKWLRSMVGEI